MLKTEDADGRNFSRNTWPRAMFVGEMAGENGKKSLFSTNQRDRFAQENARENPVIPSASVFIAVVQRGLEPGFNDVAGC
jgi:hypothetical protein